jgi:polyisoprenoid-binding protein YceI
MRPPGSGGESTRRDAGRRRRLCGAALLAGLLLAPLARGAGTAAAPEPQLVPARSAISFISHQMGVPISGEFRSFEAQVRFDPAAPATGHFVVSVDLASVVLPTRDAMQEVVKPGWFDAARFPRAQFESTSIRPAGPGRYDIAGRLLIKGHARDVTVPVRLQREGALTLASGSLTVPRLAFAIGDGEWSDTSLVADDVQIDFTLALSGLAAAAGP